MWPPSEAISLSLCISRQTFGLTSLTTDNLTTSESYLFLKIEVLFLNNNVELAYF